MTSETVRFKCAQRPSDFAEFLVQRHAVLRSEAFLTVREGDDSAQIELTPKRAKRLAKALREWAKEADR